MKKILIITLIVSFIGSSLYIPQASADVLNLPPMPQPGVMVNLSPEYTPAQLKGLIIHPENALKFDFIMLKGDTPLPNQAKHDQYNKLIKYFLASLATPDDNQWVNLSPYEKNRIIKDDFGKTEMGRDLLAQDYILKQITASLIYPEKRLGAEFWNRIYDRAYKEFGSTQIPVNTFNKVWIVPDDALVYEKGNMAYVVKSHLRVMLEEDYLSLQKHSAIVGIHKNDVNKIGSQVIREIILPELEHEVNEGKNFAPLRQVYSGMILAAWYKQALKKSLLGMIYMNKDKVKGIDQDPKNNALIYQRYLRAFKKGVYNYIREDVDKYTNEIIPRKYFSGGFANTLRQRVGNIGPVLQIENEATGPQRAFAAMLINEQKLEIVDSAMTEDLTQSTVTPAMMTLPELEGVTVSKFFSSKELTGDETNDYVWAWGKHWGSSGSTLHLLGRSLRKSETFELGLLYGDKSQRNAPYFLILGSITRNQFEKLMDKLMLDRKFQDKVEEKVKEAGGNEERLKTLMQDYLYETVSQMIPPSRAMTAGQIKRIEKFLEINPAKAVYTVLANDERVITFFTDGENQIRVQPNENGVGATVKIFVPGDQFEVKVPGNTDDLNLHGIVHAVLEMVSHEKLADVTVERYKPSNDDEIENPAYEYGRPRQHDSTSVVERFSYRIAHRRGLQNSYVLGLSFVQAANAPYIPSVHVTINAASYEMAIIMQALDSNTIREAVDDLVRRHRAMQHNDYGLEGEVELLLMRTIKAMTLPSVHIDHVHADKLADTVKSVVDSTVLNKPFARARIIYNNISVVLGDNVHDLDTSVGKFLEDHKLLASTQPFDVSFNPQDSTQAWWDLTITGPEAKDETVSPATRAMTVTSEDGRSVATMENDGETLVIRRDGEIVAQSLLPNPKLVTALAISPDGQRVAYNQGRMLLPMFVQGQELKGILLHEAHPQNIVALAYSSDGRLLGSASQDGEIIVWDDYKPVKISHISSVPTLEDVRAELSSITVPASEAMTAAPISLMVQVPMVDKNKRVFTSEVITLSRHKKFLFFQQKGLSLQAKKNPQTVKTELMLDEGDRFGVVGPFLYIIKALNLDEKVRIWTIQDAGFKKVPWNDLIMAHAITFDNPRVSEAAEEAGVLKVDDLHILFTNVANHLKYPIDFWKAAEAMPAETPAMASPSRLAVTLTLLLAAFGNGAVSASKYLPSGSEKLTVPSALVTPAPTEVEGFTKGGIDLNAANLNLQIKRDGNGVPLPLSEQNIDNIHIEGLVPEILEIRPASSSPVLSQMATP